MCSSLMPSLRFLRRICRENLSLTNLRYALVNSCISELGGNITSDRNILALGIRRSFARRGGAELFNTSPMQLVKTLRGDFGILVFLEAALCVPGIIALDGHPCIKEAVGVMSFYVLSSVAIIPLG